MAKIKGIFLDFYFDMSTGLHNIIVIIIIIIIIIINLFVYHALNTDKVIPSTVYIKIC